MRRLLLSATLALTLLSASSPALAKDVVVHGLAVIPWAAKVETDRFRSPRDFETTVRWYRKFFAGNRYVKRYREVHLPGIKYVHFENRNPRGKWSGLNIYQKGRRGEVRLYVLSKEPSPKIKKRPAGK